MNVEIISPDAILFTGQASIVTLPGVNGSFQIMNNHAPVIANLSKGSVRVGEGKDAEQFEVNGGLVEVLKNKVVVLV